MKTPTPTWDKLTDAERQAIAAPYRFILKLRQEGKIGRKPCTK